MIKTRVVTPDMKAKMPRYILFLVLLMGTAFTSCRSSKKAAGVTKDKIQVAQLDKDWLQYQLYLQPETQQAGSKTRTMNFSIRVINRQNNTSPLRRLCGNMDDYNTYYEYLLNRAKDELYLTNGTEIMYPVAYSFENNYDAFPFETINVGYKRTASKKKREQLKLVFIDRVFSHDTLVFTINHIK